MESKSSPQKRSTRGIYQDSSGRWCCEWYEGPKRKRKVVGTKSAAQEYLLREKARVREEKIFPEKAQAARGLRLTVGDLVERYQADLEANCRSVAGPTAAGKRLAKYFGDKPIGQIRPEDIELYKGWRLGQVAASTVNRDLARLRVLFNKAVANGLLPLNPMSGGRVKQLAEENTRYTYLLDHQEAKLRAVMSPEQWDVVEFAILTGLRAENQFSLTKSQCNLERSILTLQKTKSKKPRIFHLGPRGLECLKRILDRSKSEWVFPASRGRNHLSHHNFYLRVFLPALNEAGITDFVWHDLRHTYGTRCAMAGIDINTIKEQMGHSSVRVTERYMHHSPIHAKKMVQLYG